MNTRTSSTEIALLIDYTSDFYRKVVSGVARYSKMSGWRFFTTRGIPQISPEQLPGWNGAGVIGRIDPNTMVALSKRGIPAVNIKSDFLNLPVASVLMDNQQIGKIAAECFMSKGIRRFASTAWSISGDSGRLKLKGFSDFLQQHGFSVTELKNQEDIQNVRQLLPLEKGEVVGFFAAEDFLGRMVIEACQDSGLMVPEDVAVVGTDNSSFICEMLSPTMSSIELGAERVGYQAALMLDQLMKGMPVSGDPVLVAPERIIERRSSDILQMTDNLIGRALRFIQENASEPITVGNVTEALHCNRRVLEKRFRAKVNRTLHEEIRRSRIQRACQLLRETDMLIETLAESCGYSSRERFNAAFRIEMGKTPSLYRREYRFSTTS